MLNYICIKDGGKGCVREFTDKILKINKTDIKINIIKEIKDEFNYQINNYNIKTF
jgi:3-deoxy-D-manno-octulosonate 8-phosphate phosphatase KdsC-like HAD superfamily phosphatase